MTSNSKNKITEFDATDYLDTPEMIAAYLSEAFETNDRAFIASAFSDVLRSKGMAKIAKKAGASRESLYKSFDGKTEPQFSTVQKALKAMDLELVVKPKGKAAA